MALLFLLHDAVVVVILLLLDEIDKLVLSDSFCQTRADDCNLAIEIVGVNVCEVTLFLEEKEGTIVPTKVLEDSKHILVRELLTVFEVPPLDFASFRISGFDDKSINHFLFVCHSFIAL